MDFKNDKSRIKREFLSETEIIFEKIGPFKELSINNGTLNKEEGL
ncbi:hypothetical protein ADIARSV_0527 [Arcticibacter svalbardensis MN12-7]|uniref:Uncharacterized protein n=1 Tax=Arcticibacter svalbardensis MN12-7 TaxID=1150600 RepID=R9GWV7_9SPHI|nr:hypothetical protein ADIARSV_0527 [Arcticibacter svalbardensis MN12-7]